MDDLNPIINQFPTNQREVLNEVEDFIWERTIWRIYEKLNGDQKNQMREIFSSSNNKQKEEFFKNLAKEGINFQDIYFEETLKTINEVEEHLKTKETT